MSAGDGRTRWGRERGTHLAHREGVLAWATLLQCKERKIRYILSWYTAEMVQNGIHAGLSLLLAHYELLQSSTDWSSQRSML